MYAKRIKILVAISALLSGVCLLRLMQMQLLSDSFYRNRIAKLKIQKGQTLPLKTVRGRILDRKGRVLATDEPQFELHINYSLTRFMDDRVREAVLIRAAGKDNTGAAEAKARKELDEGLADLNEIILKCTSLEGAAHRK